MTTGDSASDLKKVQLAENGILWRIRIQGPDAIGQRPQGGLAESELPNKQHQQLVGGVPHPRAAHLYTGEWRSHSDGYYCHHSGTPSVQEVSQETIRGQTPARIHKVLIPQEDPVAGPSNGPLRADPSYAFPGQPL